MSDTIIKIPAELFALAESSHFEGTYDLGQLAIGPDDYSFAKPLVWEVDITNTGSALLVEGRVMGHGVCSCSRCLDDVGYDFDGAVEGYYLIGDSTPDFDDGEEKVGEDEFDVLPDDHMLDLSLLLDAALMIDAPDMPLCKPSCAGLCPQCGGNLNEGDCGCEEDSELAAFELEANPFAVLANYKFE